MKYTFHLVKRKAGENPARTRRCKEGALFKITTGINREGKIKC